MPVVGFLVMLVGVEQQLGVRLAVDAPLARRGQNAVMVIHMGQLHHFRILVEHREEDFPVFETFTHIVVVAAHAVEIGTAEDNGIEEHVLDKHRLEIVKLVVDGSRQRPEVYTLAVNDCQPVAAFLKCLDCIIQVAFANLVVGIQREQILSRASRHGEVACVANATVFLIIIMEATVFLAISQSDLLGIVLGAVVDDDTLPIGIGLPQHRIECFGQILCLVVARGDDGNYGWLHGVSQDFSALISSSENQG